MRWTATRTAHGRSRETAGRTENENNNEENSGKADDGKQSSFTSTRTPTTSPALHRIVNRHCTGMPLAVETASANGKGPPG